MPHRHRGPYNLQQGIYTQHDPLRAGSPISPPPSVFFPCPPPRSNPVHIGFPDVEAGPSVMNRTSFVYPPQYVNPEPTEPPTQIWIISFLHYVLSAVCMVYTMGLYRLYYQKFRFEGTSQHRPFDTPHTIWSRIVERMSGIWKLARIGCGVLLPLSIALLQIQGVINTVITRTSTIATSIFATAGLLSSGIYLFFGNELINSQNKTRWIEASRHSYALKSVEFWTYLALPIASLVWAILTCTVSVMCIAWTNNQNSTEESQGAFIGSAVFITCLIATSVVYLYKASAMVVRY